MAGQPMSTPPETDKSLGQIVSEASEKASLLVREEISRARSALGWILLIRPP